MGDVAAPQEAGALDGQLAAAPADDPDQVPAAGGTLVTGKVKYRWRRSLQLRVVGTTLVISATMIAVLGFFLTEQIAYGLLTNAENSAKTQALDGLNTARSQPGLTQQPTPQAPRSS